MKKYLSLALAAIMTLSLVACSSGQETIPETTTPDGTTTAPVEVVIDLEALATEIESKVEMPMLGSADEAMLTDSFGISADEVEDFMVRIPMMAVTATEYGIFKGDSQVVNAAIDKRIEALDVSWGQYLPDQHQLVLDYSVYTQGDYTMYVICNEGDKQYFENSFLRAFDPSIEELIPAMSFQQVTAEILSVEENGVTLLVDGTYTIQGTYAENMFIDTDFSTGETLVPQPGIMVDAAFQEAVVDNGDEMLQGTLVFMGISVNAMDPAVAPDMDMGDMDMGVGDMGMPAV